MSIHNTIAKYVKTQVETIPHPVTTKYRRSALRLIQETRPLAIVYKGSNRETGASSEGGMRRAYAVGVICYFNTSNVIQDAGGDELDAVPLWVQEIRQTLETQTPVITGLPTGTTVWNVEVEGPIVSEVVSAGGSYSSALIGLVVETSELRNG